MCCPGPEAQIRHRPVGDETALQLVPALPLEVRERFLHPRRAPAHALELGRPEALDERRRIRRPIGAGRVVDVQLELAPIRVGLVDDRRIDPLGEHARARQVRRLEDHRVGRRELCRGEIDRIAGRSLRDRRSLRLRLVEERQRAAARPAAQDDLLVAPHVPRVPDVRAEVEDHLLHDERRVVPREAAARAQHMHPRARHRLRHRQELQGRARMHVDGERLRRLVLRDEPYALQVHHTLRARKAVNLGELRGLRVLDVHPLGRELVTHQRSRPQRNASGFSSAASSSSPARVAGCSGSSGWRTASLLMTPPSFITVFVARRPHCRFS